MFNSTDKENITTNQVEFLQINSSVEVGGNAKFIVSSPLENVKILYEIEHKNKITGRKWIKLTNQKKLISIYINENHRGNLAVHFSTIKNNRIYKQSYNIQVPYTNKKLDVEFSTFKDKLLPGENVEWTITIKDKQKQKQTAELLATMYDKSLDKFASNNFSLDINKFFYYRNNWRNSPFNKSSSSMYDVDFNKRFSSYPAYSYDRLQKFGFNYYGNYYSGSWSGNRRGSQKTFVDGIKITNDSEEVVNFNLTAPTSSEDEKGVVSFKSVEKNDFLEKKEQSKKNKKSVVSKNKDKTETIDEEVQIRTNFNETAFFYPHLYTNKNGELQIKFSAPDALTSWKFLGLAHTKDLKIGTIEKEAITQKKLMVIPNPPRFFRENDTIYFTTKISSLVKKELSGTAKIEFFDPINNKTIENILHDKVIKDFSLKAEGSTAIQWKLIIPEGENLIAYKIIAKAENHSDGEQKAIPVLTNSMLVTESFPLNIKGATTENYTISRMKDNNSTTLRNHKLTLEWTMNPVWYAVQALPYLMEYPFECLEQTFSRFYANSIAQNIVKNKPKIQQVFEAWKKTEDKNAFLSNLEKNQELKQVLLEETPWILNAEDEQERKKRIALLFDLNKMSSELQRAMKKIIEAQKPSGAWPWFEGMPESRYITQHIVNGFGKLNNLNVIDIKENYKLKSMINKAVSYLDSQIAKDYRELKQYARRYYCKDRKDKDKCVKEYLEKNHLSNIAIHYLYTRSFFAEKPIPNGSKEAFNYYIGQAEKYWLQTNNNLSKGMIAIILKRFAKEGYPKKIIASLKEHAITHKEKGMYWKNKAGYYWYQAPIETQALLIEAFSEIDNNQETVDEMKIWLLKQKQTQDWKTTKATVEAVYALLLRGSDWLNEDNHNLTIKIGDEVLKPETDKTIKAEAGTGYFKKSWNEEQITKKQADITISKTSKGISWGALYWQYFEQLDKITTFKETPLTIDKKLFLEQITDNGKVLLQIEKKKKLKVGDKIIVRIVIRSDRAMEYVYLKDMRASSLEPINVISRYKWQEGLSYYESTKDASTNFFISYLPKGTFVFEYPLRVSQKGNFSNGITTMQSMYAPEFSSHSEGVRVESY